MRKKKGDQLAFSRLRLGDFEEGLCVIPGWFLPLSPIISPCEKEYPMPNKLFVNNPIGKAVLLGIAIYLLIGLLYRTGNLICYNVRNWDVYGGFSLPPLFVPCCLFDLLLWPVYLHANLINGLGVLGPCSLP